MNLLHDSAAPDDPILTSPLLWLLCFPLAMGIEIVRSIRRSRPVDATATRYAAGTSTRTQTY
jgi:hypothetical protein